MHSHCPDRATFAQARNLTVVHHYKRCAMSIYSMFIRCFFYVECVFIYVQGKPVDMSKQTIRDPVDYLLCHDFDGYMRQSCPFLASPWDDPHATQSVTARLIAIEQHILQIFEALGVSECSQQPPISSQEPSGSCVGDGAWLWERFGGGAISRTPTWPGDTVAGACAPGIACSDFPQGKLITKGFPSSANENNLVRNSFPADTDDQVSLPSSDHTAEYLYRGIWLQI